MIQTRQIAPGEWDVVTDLDPDTVSILATEVFSMWMEFALGNMALGGKILMHPTGKYAASLQYKKTGVARVSIAANESIAPEAAFLEFGHGAIDLKKILVPGRSYPMHRGEPGHYGSAGYGAPTRPTGRRNPKMWAVSRSRGFSGYARVPTKITAENADSWIIPPMAAYRATSFLTELLRKRVENL